MKTPPTLVLMTAILFVAVIAARLAPPGEFERREQAIARGGQEYLDHTLAPGETREAIAALYKARLIAGKPWLDARTGEALEEIAELSEGAVVRLPVRPQETRTVVVPGSYQPLERESQGALAEAAGAIGQFCLAPVKGFQDKAQIIAFILLIGGAFGIILATGAIDEGLKAVAAKCSDKGDLAVVAGLMVVFSLGGAVFGLSEEVIPFVMITVPLALRLGYDSITGLCMSFLAAGLGFAAAFLNPFTIGVAQGIAELPPFSGMGLRIVIWVVITSVGIAWALRWAKKVKARPEISPMYAIDREHLTELNEGDEGEKIRFGAREKIIVGIVALTVVASAWGVTQYHWYMDELGALFIGTGVLAAAVSGIRPRAAAEHFMKGVTDLSVAGIIVAFSGGIVYVLESGKVLDTILNAIAGSLEGLHDWAGVTLMFLFQSLLNFFVPSGSGQAAMTMPIIAPLSDLMGLTRQTAVLAFQFGDGFTNMIIPTSAVTMSVLAIARAPWTTWAKWLLPLEAILITLGVLFLGLAVAIGYS